MDRIDDIIPLVRRPEIRTVSRLSVIGLLRPLQNLFTRLLVRWTVDPRWVTVAWLAMSLASYAISAIGTPWMFALGAVVLFIAIALDLSDGEIGRAAALRLSPEDDLRIFIYGMYLDRISHSLCTPIWPMAVAWGLYRMLGRPEILAAGMAIAVYHTACRVSPHLKSYLREYFRKRIEQLDATCELLLPRATVHVQASLARRCGQKIELWVRNGKRFNFMILACSLADIALLLTRGIASCYALFFGIVVYGVLSVILLLLSIASTALSRKLLDETCQGLRDDQG